MVLIVCETFSMLCFRDYDMIVNGLPRDSCYHIQNMTMHHPFECTHLYAHVYDCSHTHMIVLHNNNVATAQYITVTTN